jgi:hypothetical protein
MQKAPKQPRFNFEDMKAEATSQNPMIRKKIFKEYFERFEEFPSYLFDNSDTIDSRLVETMEDLKNDPETTKTMHEGIAALLQRLPSTN